jgi:hypothetical protein
VNASSSDPFFQDRILLTFGGSSGAHVSKALEMLKVYHSHHIDKPFIKSNYKAALLRLEEKGLISADPPANKRPRRSGKATFGDNVMVTFKKNSD